MDQRFWGRQCNLLGVGPEPVHIEDFQDVCVDILDKALDSNSEWRAKAAQVASMMQGLSFYHHRLLSISSFFRFQPSLSFQASRKTVFLRMCKP